MPRNVSTSVVAVAALLLAVPASAPATSSPGPKAGAARGCHLTSHEQDHLGPTYLLSLRVSGTPCKNGKKVVRAYHACRHKNGRGGRCHRRIFGYTCSERRLNVINTQYDARVRCKKSGREIFHKYTQNT
jgi:hypothetical protein